MRRILEIKMRVPEKIRYIALISLLYINNVKIEQFLLCTIILLIYPQRINLAEKDPLEAERDSMMHVFGTLLLIFLFWGIAFGKNLETINVIGEGIRAIVLLVIIFVLFLPEYIRENPKKLSNDSLD